MLISELIERLERLRAEHGDLPVVYWDAEYDSPDTEAEDVEFLPGVIKRGVVKFIQDGRLSEEPWEERHEARVLIR